MDTINELMNSFSGETYNLCFQLLSNSLDKEKVFEYVCKNYSGRPEHGTVIIDDFFSKDEIEEYESLYGDTVNGLLNSTVKRCNWGLINPADFYRSLWNSFCMVFSSEKELAFAFYYTLIDSQIPYIYVGKPLSMSNERYRKLVEENKKYIDKVKYIARSGYGQRTERASLLLNCLDEIGDFEAKTVVLSQAITILNSKVGTGLLEHSAKDVDVGDLIKRIDAQIEKLEAREIASEKQ